MPKVISIDKYKSTKEMENEINVWHNLVVTTIQKVYTVEELKKMHILSEGGGGVEYGIIFAYITDINIDSETSSVVSTKW